MNLLKEGTSYPSDRRWSKLLYIWFYLHLGADNQHKKGRVHDFLKMHTSLFCPFSPIFRYTDLKRYLTIIYKITIITDIVTKMTISVGKCVMKPGVLRLLMLMYIYGAFALYQK